MVVVREEEKRLSSSCFASFCLPYSVHSGVVPQGLIIIIVQGVMVVMMMIL